jgi:hypothetical protein
MWTLPGDDLYRIVFCLADAGDVGWAAASKRLLEEWGIADSRHCAHMSYDGYKSPMTSNACVLLKRQCG